VEDESLAYLKVIMIIFVGRDIGKPTEAALLRIVCLSRYSNHVLYEYKPRTLMTEPRSSVLINFKFIAVT